MSPLAAWLLQNALVATALAGVLLLVTRWLRLRPAVEHLLWLLVMVKFVLPPLAVLTLPASVVDPVVSFASEWRPRAASVASPGEREAARPMADATPAVEAASGERVHGGTGVRTVNAGADERAALPFSLVTLVVGLWLTGALASAVWRLTRHASWRRRVAAAAEPAPRELCDIVDECALRLRVHAPHVVVSRGAPAPLVTGLRKPVLFWPAELIGTLGVERTRTIVMHELAHVRRRDLWTGVVELMVDSLWGWYPGWRVVRRRLRDAAERACDAVVVESDPERRRQYAEAILDVLSLGARRRSAALSLGVDGPGPLEQRIHGILHPQTTRMPRIVSYASLALVALAVLPWWSRGAPPPELAPMNAAAPAPSEIKPAYDIEAVTSRGVVRWDGRSLELEPGAWLIAFSKDGGSSRRVEARRVGSGKTIVRWILDGRETRPDASAVEWLRGVIDRRGWRGQQADPEAVRSASGGGGTFLNWMNNGVESVSYWSTLPHGLTRDGQLDPSADPAHPVYIIHQPTSDAPVAFMALAREGDRLIILERSVDARRAATDASSEAAASELLRRLADWMD